MKPSREEKHRAYEEAFTDWHAKLSPEDRSFLKSHGIHGPLPLDRGQVAEEDPEQESPHERAERLGGAHQGHDRAACPMCGRAPNQGRNEAAEEIVSRIALLFISAEDPRREAFILAFTAGLSAQIGLSLSKIAKGYGFSRATLSKRAREIRADLGLTPSRGMKPESACKVYKLTNGKCKSPHSHKA